MYVPVAAVAFDNAVGDVIDPSNGRIVAGTRLAPNAREFADGARLVRGGEPAGLKRSNTTLAVVATNAALSKVEASKLAAFGSLGMARTISPVNTTSDGDLTVGLSIGSKSAPIDALGVAAAEAVAKSILAAVRAAKTMGGLPGLG